MTDKITEKDLIYGVCHFLREEVEIATGEHTHCKGCELRVDSPYGPGTLGCVLRARELIELVSANERTKRLQAEHERDVLVEKLAQFGKALKDSVADDVSGSTEVGK